MALPAESVGLPRIAAPSLNVTVPVGVPALEVTVAVKFTLVPYVEGFSELTTTVALAALFTVCVSAVEVLARKLASLLYTAVMECGDALAVSADVVNVAVPALSALDPNVVAPSLKVTVPVGVPPNGPGTTLAVNFTDCPNVEGLSDELKKV